VDPFHERVARVGLEAIGRFGFVLAGGYAVQWHGIVRRPSDDVDLFTDEPDPDKFHRAVCLALAAWRSDGLSVELEKESGVFARLWVSGGSQKMKVELCYDWREDPPVLLDIGPVLSRDDSVANKVCAAWGRYFARDFIDVYGALTDGGYTKERLCALAKEHDDGFTQESFAESIRLGMRHGDSEFTQYGVSGGTLEALRATMYGWAGELDGR
jgi:hypothetical protein